MTAVLAVIPARLASTRLPEKPLARIAGKPMVAHVFERARSAKGVDAVVVATDSEKVLKAVKAAGGEAVMTAESHRNVSLPPSDSLACAPKDVHRKLAFRSSLGLRSQL